VPSAHYNNRWRTAKLGNGSKPKRLNLYAANYGR
jgi:hypothetical protein